MCRLSPLREASPALNVLRDRPASGPASPSCSGRRASKVVADIYSSTVAKYKQEAFDFHATFRESSCTWVSLQSHISTYVYKIKQFVQVQLTRSADSLSTSYFDHKVIFCYCTNFTALLIFEAWTVGLWRCEKNHQTTSCCTADLLFFNFTNICNAGLLL